MEKIIEYAHNRLKTRDREKMSEKHIKSERRTKREREWERETVRGEKETDTLL